MIIDLNTINDSNVHASLVKAGYKEYCFIGPNRPERNLLGSPLHEGPRNVLQYRQWLWNQIQAENAAIKNALRQVALSVAVVHEDTPEIAALILRAAKWYKEKVLMPQIVCTVCLTYLTDHNVGDFHLCAECAWSGRDFDPDQEENLSFFCCDCKCILHNLLSQMYGQCKPCRDKEQRELNAMHSHP